MPNKIQVPSIAWSWFQEKVSGEGVVISQGASLVIEAPDAHIRNLRVYGALRIKAVPNASITIDGLTVSNVGWNWRGLSPDKPAKEEEWIR